ncbi:MAG: hypothetical protein RM338_28045 [Nostoc sp. DedQUE12a]|nr:hypothetical protein [Nostoc sp. DedQUE12a]
MRECLNLIYLAASQQADGGFAQNFWINGEPYWQGVQLGHYELAAGHDVQPFIEAMEAFASDTGMLPE